MAQKQVTPDDTQREFKRFARNISRAKFIEFAQNINVPALIGWYALQNEETQIAILSIKNILKDFIYTLVKSKTTEMTSGNLSENEKNTSYSKQNISKDIANKSKKQINDISSVVDKNSYISKTSNPISKLSNPISKLSNNTTKHHNIYQDIQKLPYATREYVLLGLCIAIGKHIADNSLSITYREKNVGYKEKMIKENVNLIESIIFDQVASSNNHWKWADVHKEFFKRLDKKYLRGNDKLKRDFTKIMTVSYFRRITNKYIYTKSARTNDYLTKAELNTLVNEHVASLVDKYAESSEVINANEFNSNNNG